MTRQAVLDEDTVFLEVPLPDESLAQLHSIAVRTAATPLEVLRSIVLAYRRNGGVDLPAGELRNGSGLTYRGVPLTYRMLQEVNEIAAEKKAPPVVVVRAILQSELSRRTAGS